MSSKREKRVFFVTKQEYGNCQRKLAWFSRHENGLYFEVAGFFMGSHTSYHQDGKVFRTSPATRNRAAFIDKYIPLDRFEGWYQLGTVMVRKNALLKNPCLKARDRKRAITLQEIALGSYPSQTINMVIELLEPNERELLNLQSVAPPPDATVLIIDSISPWIVLTVLGHAHNLLIRPMERGFTVSHFNTRYSTNCPGVKYSYEAYKGEFSKSLKNEF